MGFEEAQNAMTEAQNKTTETPESSGTEAAGDSNGGLAPDSGSSGGPIDIDSAEKVIFQGKEWDRGELEKAILRQQDYTKKTQAIAEEKRQMQERERQFQIAQEQQQQFEDNLDVDIQNVLKNPSLEAKFKEIYPAKYHRFLEKAMTQTFGDKTSPDYEVRSLKEQFKAIQDNIQRQNQERARAAFDAEVAKDSEILDSAISRLSQKYPMAFEDVVLARAEHLATGLKKDQNFNANFSQLLEKLYKENHAEIDNLLKTQYKQRVYAQKQANTRAKDVGRGGATPGTAPAKLKLKDVKNHILSGMGQ